LYSIVLTFNRFLDELESYVRREQSLLGLASHELRTPIAVMSGALDIIEQRGRLDERDQNTLRRIRQACEEMRDNVGTLLRLARRESKEPALDLVDVGEEARQVVADVGLIHHAGARLRLQEDSALVLRADRAMVRMLLRNLIQNAVQHTQNDIRVTIGEESIEIEDEGTGLDAGEQARLRGRRQSPTDRSGMSGLGLYIVTLMTERLGWRLGIAHTDAHGTKVLIRPALRDRAPPGI
jgi:signal transduction histidine kinase